MKDLPGARCHDGPFCFSISVFVICGLVPIDNFGRCLVEEVDLYCFIMTACHGVLYFVQTDTPQFIYYIQCMLLHLDYRVFMVVIYVTT